MEKARKTRVNQYVEAISKINYSIKCRLELAPSDRRRVTHRVKDSLRQAQTDNVIVIKIDSNKKGRKTLLDFLPSFLLNTLTNASVK